MSDIVKKKKDADTEAAEYMELQLSLSKSSKISNLLITVLTLGFIFTFAVLFWVLPDQSFSAEENRSLQAMPEVSFENLFSGNLTKEVSDYMADQFPCRNFFVGVKAAAETVQLKFQNNSVILAKDGYLVARNDYPDENNLSVNISSAANFAAAADKKGIDCIAAFAGRKQDVADEVLPAAYDSHCADRIWGILDEKCTAGSLDYLDLRSSLRALEADGKELYYKNDHHWNSEGAYYAYCEIAKALGAEPYSLSDFEKEVASEDFFGTTWSSSGIKWAKPDEIDYYHWDGEENITMKILEPSRRFESYEGCEYVEEDGKTYAVFNTYFVREFLSEKDKYASFLGGNFGYTEITAPGEDRETVLLLKDSFSHSTVQFLARHYNLVLIDLRYYSGSVMKLCEEAGITKTVMLYNMETLTEGAYLRVLNSGLN